MPPSRPSDKPTSAHVNRLRQYLRDHGMSNADAQRLVKSTLTLGQIDNDIAADLRQRPKAQK